VFLWKWKTNEVISRQELPYAIGHVAFSPDGAWLLTESGVLGWESTIIQIWSPLTGLEAARLEGYVAAFSPDGKKVAVAKDNTVVIWEWNRKLLEAISPVADVLNGSSIFSLAGLTFSLDGQWVATVGENTVQVWEMTTGREIARIAPEDLHTVEFSPGKEWLVTGGWDITQVWETTTWQEVVRREGEASPIIFSRNGRWIAAVGNNGHEVQVWETATGQDVAHVTSNDLVSAIEFSPDGHLLAIGSWDHTARVWDVEMGQEVARMAHEASVETVAFSPNGQWVASGGADGVRVWETATGQEVGKLEYKDVNALAFSPDGQRMIVTSMRKNLAWLLDTRTWQEVAQMSHMGPAIFEGFTPDSQWILTRDDVVPYSNVPTGRTARIWSAITGQEQIRFESQDLMRAASFILNSPWLFTKDDLGAHIWFWRHEDLITEACARLPRNLTPGEWRQYIGDETYRPTCPNQLVPGD